MIQSILTQDCRASLNWMTRGLQVEEIINLLANAKLVLFSVILLVSKLPTLAFIPDFWIKDTQDRADGSQFPPIRYNHLDSYFI